MRAVTSGTNAGTGSDAGSAAAYTVTTLEHIADVPASQWDALAGRGSTRSPRHAFLDALERHGCVGERRSDGFRRTSWCTPADQLVGATPAYVKLHSQGEFVFDWSWAEAYSRHGLEYYPKLISAIPFTPLDRTQGLLVHPAAPRRTRCSEPLQQRAVEDFEGDAGIVVSLVVPAREPTPPHWKASGLLIAFRLPVPLDESAATATSGTTSMR